MWVNISVTIIHDKLMINLTIVQTDLHSAAPPPPVTTFRILCLPTRIQFFGTHTCGSFCSQSASGSSAPSYLPSCYRK